MSLAQENAILRLATHASTNTHALYTTLLSCSELSDRLHSSNFLVQRQDVWKRSNGGDGKRVDRKVAFGIVVLDVEEVCGFFECRHVPVEVSEPLVNVRVA